MYLLPKLRSVSPALRRSFSEAAAAQRTQVLPDIPVPEPTSQPKKRIRRSEVQKATNLSDTAEEMATATAVNYPHKNSAQFMFRDYMRVITRKYNEPERSRLKAIVREMFLEHAHLPKSEMFQVMGEGTRFLGLMACEEEMHDRGLRHTFLKTKFDIRDELDSVIDCKTLEMLPYTFQLRLWTDYGLDEYGQTTAWLAMHNSVGDANKLYNRAKKIERDNARKWVLRRMDRYEQATERSNKRALLSRPEKAAKSEAKLRELFETLDTDKDGFVTYIDFDNAKLAQRTGPGWLDVHTFCYICDLTGISDYEQGMDFDAFRALYLHHGYSSLENDHLAATSHNLENDCVGLVDRAKAESTNDREFKARLRKELDAATLPPEIKRVLLRLGREDPVLRELSIYRNRLGVGERVYNTNNELPFGLASIYVLPRIQMLHNIKYFRELTEHEFERELREKDRKPAAEGPVGPHDTTLKFDDMKDLPRDYSDDEVEPAHKKNWDPREAVLGMDVANLSVKDIRYLLDDLGLEYDANVPEEYFDKEGAAREIENKVFSDFEPEIDFELRSRFLLVRPFDESRLVGPWARSKKPTFLQIDRIYKKQLATQGDVSSEL